MPANFDTIALPHRLAFHHSRELPVAVRHGNASTCFVLVGLVCDPASVAFDHADILASVMEGVPAPEVVVQRTYRLAGRWAILMVRDDRQIVFHDACGTDAG